METSSSEDDTPVGGTTGGDGGVKAGSHGDDGGIRTGNHGDKGPSLPVEVLFSIDTLSSVEVEVCVLVVYISHVMWIKG